MIPEIRRRVKEGRWELTASAWVEPDKNMISAESMARHILYTKTYLAGLFSIDPDELQIDFEPDTFGHSENVPEILAQGGIKYYYFCRGNDQEEAFVWRAPSGSEVLTLRDPQWYYLHALDYHIAYHVPSFCRKNHTRCALRMYGVGDHGGGPTRRDIERIRDMAGWPLMPNIQFSTLHGFFEQLQLSRAMLPVVRRELNFVFTGCYTSQSRIKQANRLNEDHLYDCEALCAMQRMLTGEKANMPGFADAWKSALFNQFHDILPGSGVRETREYALGSAQQVNAVCLANAKRAMRMMGLKIATDMFPAIDDPNSCVEGGGAGFNCAKASVRERGGAPARFNPGSAGNTGGSVRVYTLFNSTQYPRKERVELTLWDWREPLEATRVTASDGSECAIDAIEKNVPYWHHTYCVIAFVADVPAFGYANYYVLAADQPAARTPYFSGPRVQRMEDGLFVMENEKIRAVFIRETMELTALTDKASGRRVIDAPSAYFRMVDEQDHPYSAWTIGQIGKSENINKTQFVRVTGEGKETHRQWIRYEMRLRDSSMYVMLSLPENEAVLRYSLEINWHEKSELNDSVPQLQFYVPYAYKPSAIRAHIPGGYVDRGELGHDIPAIEYVSAVPETEQVGLMLTTDCKYGCRGFQNALSVTLMRASHKPDLLPESGMYQAEIGLGCVNTANEASMLEAAVCFSHPIYAYANDVHAGKLPQRGCALTMQGGAVVSALKPSEDGEGVVLRAYSCDDGDTNVLIQSDMIAAARMTDLLERDTGDANVIDHHVKLRIPAKSIRTFKFFTIGRNDS